MKKSIILFGCASLLAVATANAADLVSTFDNGKENWRRANDANPITWMLVGGNPDGHIEVVDDVSGETWYFVSPTSWAGDWSSYKNLSFDLRQFGTGETYMDKDVIIVGNNGKKLVWQGNRIPSDRWTSFSLSLEPNTFKVGQAHFDSVMASVKKLMIRGEYINGDDVGGLDNVVLSEASTEVQGTLKGWGKYTLTCENTTTTQIVTLVDQVTLDWNCEQAGLTINDGDTVTVTISGPLSK